MSNYTWELGHAFLGFSAKVDTINRLENSSRLPDHKAEIPGLTFEYLYLLERWDAPTYIRIADGAASNWQFLNPHTQQQILDFYYASGYLGAVAVALYPNHVTQQNQWLNEAYHQLKHDAGAAAQLYQQMLELSHSPYPKPIQDNLKADVIYFHNHLHQMDYAL
jgi:hypothetical protein